MPLALDPILLEVLACPDTHHAPLRVGTDEDPDAEVLTCTECGRRFPVQDGIPVLLLDAAIDGSPTDGSSSDGRATDGRATDGRATDDAAITPVGAAESSAVEASAMTPDDGQQAQR